MFIASSQMIENLIIILKVYKQYIEQTYMYIKTKKHVRVMLRIYTVIFFNYFKTNSHDSPSLAT